MRFYERPSGSEEGVASNRDPYSDLKIASMRPIAYLQELGGESCCW
jgi:hypothetical protein